MVNNKARNLLIVSSVCFLGAYAGTLHLARALRASGHAVKILVAATEVEGERISDPFYSLVLLPTGASVVPGSSAILDQASKAPDDTGACPDGRTFLRFNFKPGEIANPFHFSKFAAVLVFQIVADRAANETQIIADSALEPYADPCLTPLDSANASLSVLEN